MTHATSFLDFIECAGGNLPILIYRAGSDLPPYTPCKWPEDCWDVSRSPDPDYVVVMAQGARHFPEQLLRLRNDLELICVPTEFIRVMLSQKQREPLAAIWWYADGPCQYSQHGGDEDWTAVVRTVVYCTGRDRLNLDDRLDNRVSCEDIGDFTIYTGAHA